MKGFFGGRGGRGLEVSRNYVSFKGYLAKGNEKRQREGGGHNVEKLGRHRLWMPLIKNGTFRR